MSSSQPSSQPSPLPPSQSSSKPSSQSSSQPSSQPMKSSSGRACRDGAGKSSGHDTDADVKTSKSSTFDAASLFGGASTALSSMSSSYLPSVPGMPYSLFPGFPMPTLPFGGLGAMPTDMEGMFANSNLSPSSSGKSKSPTSKSSRSKSASASSKKGLSVESMKTVYQNMMTEQAQQMAMLASMFPHPAMYSMPEYANHYLSANPAAAYYGMYPMMPPSVAPLTSPSGTSSAASTSPVAGDQKSQKRLDRPSPTLASPITPQRASSVQSSPSHGCSSAENPMFAGSAAPPTDRPSSRHSRSSLSPRSSPLIPLSAQPRGSPRPYSASSSSSEHHLHSGDLSASRQDGHLQSSLSSSSSHKKQKQSSPTPSLPRLEDCSSPVGALRPVKRTSSPLSLPRKARGDRKPVTEVSASPPLPKKHSKFRIDDIARSLQDNKAESSSTQSSAAAKPSSLMPPLQHIDEENLVQQDSANPLPPTLQSMKQMLDSVNPESTSNDCNRETPERPPSKASSSASEVSTERHGKSKSLMNAQCDLAEKFGSEYLMMPYLNHGLSPFSMFMQHPQLSNPAAFQQAALGKHHKRKSSSRKRSSDSVAASSKKSEVPNDVRGQSKLVKALLGEDCGGKTTSSAGESHGVGSYFDKFAQQYDSSQELAKQWKYGEDITKQWHLGKRGGHKGNSEKTSSQSKTVRELNFASEKATKGPLSYADDQPGVLDLSSKSSDKKDYPDHTGESSTEESIGAASEAENSNHTTGFADEEIPIKKRKFDRRMNTENLNMLRMPLESGWCRLTRVKGCGQRGLIGEVVYITPCGRKLRTYQDVLKYLEKNNLNGLTRDNFSFSSNLNLGTFSDANTGLTLSHLQVEERLEEAKLYKATAKSMKKSSETNNKSTKVDKLLEQQKQVQQQQQLAIRLNEIRALKKMEKQAALEETKRERERKALELKREKERQKLIKQQEKYEKQEQIRVEREIRAQQLIEERERRRQHMLLMKALETRKRYDDREKQREERRVEKELEKERKIEERRREEEREREMSRAVEDMALGDLEPMPDIPRVCGVLLTGRAYADCLMTCEMLHTFAGALNLDEDQLPDMEMLQNGLLEKDEASVDDLISLITVLLHFAIRDPGIPNSKECICINNEKLMDVDIGHDNFSEVLRLFMKARNGSEDEITETLRTQPFSCLSVDHKAAGLAYLVNELLTSRSIISEIDKEIENVGNLRRDKWVIDCKIRRLRIVQAKKFLKGQAVEEEEDEDGKEEEDGKDEEEESVEAKGEELEEENNLTAEDLESKMESLSKNYEVLSWEVVGKTRKLRARDLGQDRFRRRHWCLTKAGGVFLESLESCENHDDPVIQSIKLNAEKSATSPKSTCPTNAAEQSAANSNPEKCTEEEAKVTDGPIFESRKPPVVYSQPLTNGESKTLVAGLNGMNLSSINKFQINGHMQQVQKEEEVTPACSMNVNGESSKDVVMYEAVVKPDEFELNYNKEGFLQSQMQKQAASLLDLSESMAQKDGNSIMHGLVMADFTSMNALDQPISAEQMLRNLSTKVSHSNEWFSIIGSKRPCDELGPVFCQKLSKIYSKSEELTKMEEKPLQPIPQEMQRGWWRIGDEESLRKTLQSLHPRGSRERLLKEKMENQMDYLTEACSKELPSFVALSPSQAWTDLGGMAVNPSSGQHASPEHLRLAEIAVLEEVEALEDRVLSASLQMKSWKAINKITDGPMEHLVCSRQADSSQQSILNVAKERLLEMESQIERRYLRVPFSRGTQVHINDPAGDALSDAEQDDVCPPALLRWRQSVKEAISAAQLTMCTVQLNRSIAWEKSIMKVSCQICCKDDNEAKLLLCDSCDKGFHTYCFKPKLEDIPSGDWFCYECIAKAASEHRCVVCGTRDSRSKLMKCEKCPRRTHFSCIEHHRPTKAPRRWYCAICALDKGRRRPELEEVVTPSPPSNRLSEMERCGQLLTELQAHKLAWPFLVPVNTKLLPTYKKHIKHAMDLQTISDKVENNQYQNTEEFASDVKLIFHNCQIFNEDESVVGQAGHSMAKYFESRWKELQLEFSC